MKKKQYTKQDLSKACITKYKDNSFLRVETIENGIVLPYKKIKDGPKYGAGGVLNAKRQFVPISGIGDEGYLKYGASYEFDDAGIEKITENVIWFGLFFKHWGHFLIELVGRMWYLLDHYKNEKIVYIGRKDVFEGTFLELMRLLGVPEENLIKINQPVQFKSITVPSYAATEFYYTDMYKMMFSRITEVADKIKPAIKGIDKVYFNRKSFWDSKWKDFGEKNIEKIFLKNGFVSISPEALSLREQIFIWNSAKEIACINGSIPLNLLFCQKKTDVIVLNKTIRRHENLFNIQHIMNYPITYVDIFYEKYAHLVTHMGSGPFLMYNSPFLQEYCKEQELMNNGEYLICYPLRARLSLLRFKYFNYYIYLGKAKRLLQRLLKKADS